MTEEQRSFILVQFRQLGSTDYTMDAEGITSAQLFLVAEILRVEAEQAYLKEKMEAHQLALQNQIATPSEGIAKL